MSLKSMTAYGRASISCELGRFTIEISTINRRHLEVQFSIPNELTFLETEMRKWIAERIYRGQVSLNLAWTQAELARTQVVPNLPLAKSLYEAWTTIGEALNLGKPDFSLLAKEKNLLSYEALDHSESDLREAISKLLLKALDLVEQMRVHEGQRLAEDLFKRVSLFEESIQKMESTAPQAVVRMQERLEKKLQGLFSAENEFQERLLKEVALFADRVDITEEITRLKCHVVALRNYLENLQEEAIGKTLDFLIQEMNRECNTIGAKASDAALSHHVVAAKSQLEKMREQIQNVE